MKHFHVLVLIFALVALAPRAYAEKRVALVIGNSAYEHTTALRNSKNDATGIATLLGTLGFEVVDGFDLDKRTMERTIRDFGRKLTGADVALFFYAGHGMQILNQNYLLPTDARLVNESDVDFETVPLTLVLKLMEREAKASLVLLDACRDNPLVSRLARSSATRSAQVGQGLAEVRSGVGTLIGFSTQPGNFALDGTGTNSPYAEALLRHMATPGQDVSAIMSLVRGEVVKSTSGMQVPWEHTSLVGQVYFKPALPKSSPAAIDPAVQQFDGIWAITRSVEPGCGTQGQAFTVVIKDGVVRAPGGTGSITATGVLKIPGQANIFSGTLEGDSGNGSYMGRCTGTFTAKRG